jgi:hypothetical protein
MTLPASTRYKLYQPVVLTADFAVTFPIFSTDDLKIVVDGSETELYSVTASFVDGRSDDAMITLNSEVSDVDVEIYGARIPQRENDYLPGSPDLGSNLQRDADQLTAVQQEQARDFKGALYISPQHPEATPLSADLASRSGRVLSFSADGKGLEVGPASTEISSAQGYAEAAKIYSEAAATFDPALFLPKSGNLAGVADKDAALGNLGLTTIGKNLVKAATAAAMRTILELKAGALAEKADQPTAEAGVDDTKYMHALGTKQAIEVRQATSGPHAIVAGGQVVIAHGLSSAPRFINYKLKCLVAEAGYSIGDELFVDFNNSGNDVSRYNAAIVDATNITIRFSIVAASFVAGHKTTGSIAGLTNANWELYVEAMV